MSAAPRMKAPEGRAFTTALTILGGPAALRVTGAPWWVVYSLCVLGILVTSLRTIFPQDSQDKVTWWREHWLMRRHYQCQDVLGTTDHGPTGRLVRDRVRQEDSLDPKGHASHSRALAGVGPGR
jgi:hypothetical protein